MLIAQIVGALGPNAVVVLETVVAICRANRVQHSEAMKAVILGENDSEDESFERVSLQAVATCMQPLLRRPPIERAFVIPGVIMADNAQRCVAHCETWREDLYTIEDFAKL